MDTTYIDTLDFVKKVIKNIKTTSVKDKYFFKDFLVSFEKHYANQIKQTMDVFANLLFNYYQSRYAREIRKYPNKSGVYKTYTNGMINEYEILFHNAIVSVFYEESYRNKILHYINIIKELRTNDRIDLHSIEDIRWNHPTTKDLANYLFDTSRPNLKKIVIYINNIFRIRNDIALFEQSLQLIEYLRESNSTYRLSDWMENDYMLLKKSIDSFKTILSDENQSFKDQIPHIENAYKIYEEHYNRMMAHDKKTRKECVLQAYLQASQQLSSIGK